MYSLGTKAESRDVKRPHTPQQLKCWKLEDVHEQRNENGLQHTETYLNLASGIKQKN